MEIIIKSNVEEMSKAAARRSRQDAELQAQRRAGAGHRLHPAGTV